MRQPSAAILVACALACALVLLPGALAGAAADPGVTPSSIRLGTTSAVANAAVARGLNAYLAHVNARGGIAGRKLELTIRDDAGDPEQTLEATRELIEDDEVLAVVSPFGTDPGLATRAYLNEEKVPQLFVASGASAWGKDRARFPWSIGFQPSSRAEGWVYGRYVGATLRNAKVAVLLRRGDVDGVELLAGLRRGLGGSGAKVVAVESYEDEETSIQPRVATLRGSGANAFAIFATPPFAAQAHAAVRRLGWKPRAVVSAPSSAGRGSPVVGAISLAFRKSPVDPQWKDDPGMKLYRTVMAKYARGANARDPLHVHGMAVAFETVALLRRTGANPTRAGLMARARSITSAGNPFLLPGVAVRTSRTDGFPVQQGRLERWTKGRWRPFGGLWSAPAG